MNVFYSDIKTDLKLRCESCVNSSYSGVPKMFLVDWRLSVECYYPTTLQITPALQEAGLWALLQLQTSIFVDISDFWALLLSELYGYSTPRTTLLDKNKSLIHRPVLIFQPTVSSRASDKQGELCYQQHYSLTAQLLCVRHMNQGFWRDVGGGGDPFWLHREALNFKDPAAYQNTAVFQEWTQNSSKLRHTMRPLYGSFRYLNGSLRDPFMGHSASKG